LAYETAGREQKRDVVESVRSEIANAKSLTKSKWARSFLHDAHEEISRKRSIPSMVPVDNDERELLLKAIFAVDGADGVEYMERVFSMRVFGDSKTFERAVKLRLLKILRTYLDNDDDVTDDDVLKQVGIVKYPEQFEFCGNISIRQNAGMTDFACLPSGSVIYSTDLSTGHLVIDPSVELVISIENRANYIDYIRNLKANNELVIYHGGQFSPRKRVFFQTVAQEMPTHCTWYHWGDIDYGGFLMLSRIRTEIAQSAMPYRMCLDELVRHNDFTVPIKPHYADKLKTLKTHPELNDCCDCIKYMIHNMIRLEQEAMISKD
jgi:hypothetical protein